jgi:hypothetical protein
VKRRRNPLLIRPLPLLKMLSHGLRQRPLWKKRSVKLWRKLRKKKRKAILQANNHGPKRNG